MNNKAYEVPLLLIVRSAGVGAILRKILNGEMEVPDGFLAENMEREIVELISGLAQVVPTADLIEAEKAFFGTQNTYIN